MFAVLTKCIHESYEADTKAADQQENSSELRKNHFYRVLFCTHFLYVCFLVFKSLCRQFAANVNMCLGQLDNTLGLRGDLACPLACLGHYSLFTVPIPIFSIYAFIILILIIFYFLQFFVPSKRVKGIPF